MNWGSFIDWGSLASIVSLGVALIGLGVVGHQAFGARRAAEQANKAVSNVLTQGSGNRAVALLQQLKILLQKGRWEAAYHQCQTTRALLNDLRITGLHQPQFQLIDQAVEDLTDIENDLDTSIRKGNIPARTDDFNSALSRIQTELEAILSKATASRGG